MTDLERLGLGLIGFAVAVVVAGVLLGLIAAWINRGHRD
jgi:predicted membrane protein